MLIVTHSLYPHRSASRTNQGAAPSSPAISLLAVSKQSKAARTSLPGRMLFTGHDSSQIRTIWGQVLHNALGVQVIRGTQHKVGLPCYGKWFSLGTQQATWCLRKHSSKMDPELSHFLLHFSSRYKYSAVWTLTKMFLRTHPLSVPFTATSWSYR